MGMIFKLESFTQQAMTGGSDLSTTAQEAGKDSLVSPQGIQNVPGYVATLCRHAAIELVAAIIVAIFLVYSAFQWFITQQACLRHWHLHHT